MFEIEIPGLQKYIIEHLVLDVNGTISKDGTLLDGVAERLSNLKNHFKIHLLTADTFGKQEIIDNELGIKSVRLTQDKQDYQKESFVQRLGAEKVVAIGNGANDAKMLKAAAIGIAVIGDEGLCVDALKSADMVMPNIVEALNLFENPKRLIATLRR